MTSSKNAIFVFYLFKATNDVVDAILFKIVERGGTCERERNGLIDWC